jgi:hypothetical protein
MWTPFFLSVLSFVQVAGEESTQGPRKRFEAVLELASKESDLDRAGLILSSLLADERTFRSALASSIDLDDRSPQ